MSEKTDVVIIGAGLAGLAAARTLARAGVPSLVLEADDDVGGRARTDLVEGYRIDRGFQVYQTAYPEGRKVFDPRTLDLKPFEPGAMIRYDGAWHTLMDPWRRPSALISGALARVGTIADKLNVGSMRSQLQHETPEEIYARPETTILRSLRARGFSEAMIDRFWRPFFGGITLDASLGASSRMMEFVFRQFSLGDAAVPTLGMGELARQIAGTLPGGSVRLRTRATGVRPGVVETEQGPIQARCVVLACPPDAARALTGSPAPGKPTRGWRGVTNLAYAIEGPAPVKGAMLMLDGEGRGPVINLAFMSEVSPAYAPPGKALASATVLGVSDETEADLGARVLAQMGSWFGQERVATWRLLRVSRLPRALPDQSPPWLTTPHWPARLGPGLFRAGDWFDTASIDGALVSGRRAGEAALQELTEGGDE
jgi:phytoene dehydrogenase-like protein